MLSYIQLREMKFYSFHGVLEQERKVGNTFTVDLTLWLDLSWASESDELSDTVSYAAIYEVVKAEMEIPSNLLEHVAGRILRKIKKEFPEIQEIEIRVSKLNPPISGQINAATIMLRE